MKVSGPGSNRPVNLRRADKRGSEGGASGKGFSVDNADDATGSAPITGGHGVTPVASLLALQEVGDALDSRSKGLAYGRDLLEMLDQIRLGLLLGRVPEAQLKRVIAALGAQKSEFGDPRLSLVIQEIETRAAVELAKFDKIRDNNQ